MEKDFFGLRTVVARTSSPRSSLAASDTLDVLEVLCVGTLPVPIRPPATATAPLVVDDDELPTLRDLVVEPLPP